MARSVFSDRWYRVVGLRPRLRANVRADRQIIRDEIWHLLSAGAKAKTFRLNLAAWAFVARCDGSRTVQQVWDLLLAQNSDDTPTQSEVVQLLTQLYKAGLVEFENSPDVELMVKQQQKERQSEVMQRMNPLSFRVGIGDPSAWLSRCDGLAKAVYSGIGLMLWSTIVLIGVVLLLMQWDDLGRHAGKWMATPRYIVIAWLCYPFVKALHELGHALAVIRWGGQVREAGIGLFMLLPVPYVDASDSTLFVRRHQRALVSAAGIMAELVIAVIGLAVWSITEPGLVQDIGFTVAFISGFSTLLFNANPLMRLDGYYLLCDLVQLPNLAARSTQHWQSLTVRRLLRVADTPAQQLARGERLWLTIYGPSAWLYRLLIVYCLLMWAGAFHPALGIVVGLMATLTMIVAPLAIGARQLLAQIPAGRGQRGARLRFGLGLSALIVALTVVPLPDRTIAQGVVWLPEQAQIRSLQEGFLVAIAEPGARVAAGTAVVELDDPVLDNDYRKLLARRQGLEAGLHQTLGSDIFKSRQIQEEISATELRLRDVQQRREQLRVAAASAGRLTFASANDLPGRFFKQGETIGYLIGTQRPVVRVALQQQDAAYISEGVQRVSLRLAQMPGRELSGRLVRSTPSAVERLPSAALGDRGGGDIVVDPNDKDGTRAVVPTYVLDVESNDMPIELVGGRAWVRFEYGWASAATQSYRHLRQLMLLNFSPVES